jgi:Protein of unknown function (DUF2281)
MAIAANIEQRIMSLPPRARREVIDFVEFLALKYQKKQEVIQEDVSWKQMSAASLGKVWDNTEDDVYNELL